MSSLICPTAAGRRMLLSDVTQAGADCFAQWVLSYNPEKGRGSIPIMPFEKADLRNFSAERWATKWFRQNQGNPKVTERKRAAYIAAMLPYEGYIQVVLRSNPELVADIYDWSNDVAKLMPAAMQGAVTILKAYRVVTL